MREAQGANQVHHVHQVIQTNQVNLVKGMWGKKAGRPNARCTIVCADAGRRKGFSPVCGAGLAGYQRGGGGAVSPSARRASRSRKRR